jgi:hypothetical protein
LDIGLLDDGGERLLGQTPRLEEAGNVAGLPELGDAQLDGPRARLPVALSVAIVLGEPVGALLAVAGARRPPTSRSISRCAAKPIISRSRSASALFPSDACRFITSSVIVVSVV